MWQQESKIMGYKFPSIDQEKTFKAKKNPIGHQKY